MQNSSGGSKVSFSVLEADSALSRVLPFRARLERLAGGFGFTEGPIWVSHEGCLFSDIPNDVIRRWSPDGTVHEILSPTSGIRGLFVSRSDVESPGANRMAP